MHFLLMSWRIEAVTLNVLIDPASQFYNSIKIIKALQLQRSLSYKDAKIQERFSWKTH